MQNIHKIGVFVVLILIFQIPELNAQKLSNCNRVVYERRIDSLLQEIYVWLDTINLSHLNSNPNQIKYIAYKSWWEKHPKEEWMHHYYGEKRDLILQVPVNILPLVTLKSMKYNNLSLLSDECTAWDAVFLSLANNDSILFCGNKKTHHFFAVRTSDTMSFNHITQNEFPYNFDEMIDTFYFQQKALEIQNLYLVGNDTLKLHSISPTIALLTITEGLYLANNQLSSLPKNLAKLPIKILDISHNNFKILPNCITKMPFLEIGRAHV